MKIVTYWYHKRDSWKPNKRYILIFNTFNNYKIISQSISQYDSLVDCMEESNELDLLYKLHKLPIEKKEFFIGASKKNRYSKSEQIKTVYDFSDNRSWWGYIILDMQNCKCIKVGGYGLKLYVSKHIDSRESISIVKYPRQINSSVYMLDYFFRDTNVCPDEYNFDGVEEYDGWIQYKWGDGKNAIVAYDIETGGLDNCFN